MKPPRKTARLPESIQHQLNMYALTASAAGVSVLALGRPVEAKIVYTPAHVKITTNHSARLDLNHDGITDFVITLSHSGKEFGFLSANGLVPQNKVAGYAAPCGRGYYNYAFVAGVQVGSKIKFLSAAYRANLAWYFSAAWGSDVYGPWAGVKARYLGLEFNVNGETHYGWARLNVLETISPVNLQILLTGYAYETIANKPIIAGNTKGLDDAVVEESNAANTIPNPQHAALGALAMGAPGLSIWRRKESALEGN